MSTRDDDHCIIGWPTMLSLAINTHLKFCLSRENFCVRVADPWKKKWNHKLEVVVNFFSFLIFCKCGIKFISETRVSEWESVMQSFIMFLPFHSRTRGDWAFVTLDSRSSMKTSEGERWWWCWWRSCATTIIKIEYLCSAHKRQKIA